MSTRALSFFLTLIVFGLLFGVATNLTTPEFVCDGYGQCWSE
jgi:hypothetical protein